MALALMFVCAKLSAQSINPVQDAFSFEVKSIYLQGFSDLDKYHLDLKKLQTLLETERAKYEAQMTVDEIHQIADTMTLWVRNQGFSFHTVYLPPQEVVNGRVNLILQEGKLTNVNVLNKTSWPSKRFSAPFKSLVGKLLYAPEIESKVFDLKAQPGTRVFAFYSRGQKPGEATLNIRVDKADKRNFVVKAENYGSEIVGENRMILQYSEYQLTGHFDRLSMSLLHTLDGEGSLYGSFNYAISVQPLNWSVDFSASNNQFNLGNEFAALDYQGEVQSLRMGINRYFNQAPGKQNRLRLSYYDLSSDVETNLDQPGTSVADDELSKAIALSWEKQYSLKHWRFSTSIGLNSGSFSITGNGSSEDESSEIIDESFKKYSVGVAAVTQLSNVSRWSSQLHFSLQVQHSNQMLPGIERLSATGAYANRAFESGLYSADKGAIASVEWSFPGLQGKNKDKKFHFIPYVFYDWSQGEKLNSEGESSQDIDFSGAGLGLHFQIGRNISGGLVVAKPVGDNPFNTAEEDETQFLFEMRYHP